MNEVYLGTCINFRVQDTLVVVAQQFSKIPLHQGLVAEGVATPQEFTSEKGDPVGATLKI